MTGVPRMFVALGDAVGTVAVGVGQELAGARAMPRNALFDPAVTRLVAVVVEGAALLLAVSVTV